MSLDDADKETDVMLTWLSVSDRTHPMPSIAASWRRQGIGQFMFILIIKQCAAFLDGANIEVFLQCHEPGAFRFYCMLGFQRLNSNHDDGFTLLPKKLQDVLFAVPPNKKKGRHRQSTFYRFRIPEDMSILDFQVQTYSTCIFIHKGHKEQVENSFLV